MVLGHWTITTVGRSDSGLAAGNVLATMPWLWLATWVLQVMPVFFFVGGFANMVSWQTLERRGGGYVQYLSGRMARLLRPVLIFVAVWLVLPLVGRSACAARRPSWSARSWASRCGSSACTWWWWRWRR